MTLGIWVHALDDKHSQFIDIEAPEGPPKDLPWHTIEGFLKVDEFKLEWFASGDVLLL